jgi:predicted Zn-dependent protease
MQGQHDNLIKTVDRLIASIQDPYLNLLKVNSLLELNRIDEAHKAVADAKAASPDRIDIYWTETSIALKEQNHAATAALLDEISEKFGMTFNDLNQISEYANFAQSEIGKEWIARHAAESSIAEPAVPSETTAPVNETPANEAPVNDAPAADAAPVVPEQ